MLNPALQRSPKHLRLLGLVVIGYSEAASVFYRERLGACDAETPARARSLFRRDAKIADLAGDDIGTALKEAAISVSKTPKNDATAKEQLTSSTPTISATKSSWRQARKARPRDSVVIPSSDSASGTEALACFAFCTSVIPLTQCIIRGKTLGHAHTHRSRIHVPLRHFS